jgi:hypothetical protein
METGFRHPLSINIIQLVRFPTMDFSDHFNILYISALLRCGVLVQLGPIHANAAGGCRWPTQGVIGTVGDRTFKTTGAHIDGSLIGGVPVTCNWRVLWQRQVGLGLVDLLRFVGVLVDDRLGYRVLMMESSLWG